MSISFLVYGFYSAGQKARPLSLAILRISSSERLVESVMTPTGRPFFKRESAIFIVALRSPRASPRVSPTAIPSAKPSSLATSSARF